MVQVTEHGVQIFDEVHREAQGIADKLVAHLKPGEPEQLMDLLTRYTYPEL
jgi:MarR family transcriptional regulator, lower aerobic nicotinate degradation pathway regulator